MKEFEYSVTIDQKIDVAFSHIFKKEVYKEWGKAFTFSSSVVYDGELHKGAEITFLDENNNKMTGVISNFIENEFIEFTYKTMFIDGETIHLADGTKEAYIFEDPLPDKTLITVELIMPEDQVKTCFCYLLESRIK